MRPTTGPTAYVDDVVGTFVPAGRRPMIDAAYEQGRLVREGDPEWRDHVPVRVETIPVRRAGRVIAVIARHTNLLGVRTPSRLELSYLQTAADLTQMIAGGHFPAPGQRSDHADSPRVGDGFVRIDAARPGHLRQPERPVGLSQAGALRRPRGAGAGRRHPRAGAAPAPPRRGDGLGGARRTSPPRHRARHRRRDPDRPVHPAAAAGRAEWRAGAAARRDRPPAARPRAGDQGRHHPRDPPPGEEQPADGRRAAAAPGPPDRRRRGEGRAGGGGAAGRLDRDRARDAERGRRRGGRLRRDRRPARPDGDRGQCHGGAGADRAEGVVRRAVARTSPPRWRWCSPRCSRTPSSTGTPRRTPAGSRCPSAGWWAGWRWSWRTTGGGYQTISTSTPRRAWVSRSSGRSWSPSWGVDSWSPRRRQAPGRGSRSTYR